MKSKYILFIFLLSMITGIKANEPVIVDLSTLESHFVGEQSGDYIITGSTSKYKFSFTGSYFNITLDNISFTPGGLLCPELTGGDFYFNLSGYNSISPGGWMMELNSGNIYFTGDTLENKRRFEKSECGIKIAENGAYKSIILNGGFIELGCIGSAALDFNLKPEYLNKIAINDGVLTTKYLAAQEIIINGGSVKLLDALMIKSPEDSIVLPKNDDGDNVFCVKVPHGDSLSIKVKNLSAPEKEDRIMKFQAHHRDDEFFYIWLPCGDYEFFNGTDLYHATIEENIYKANVPRALVEYSEVEKPGDGYIDLSEKDIEFTDEGYNLYSIRENFNEKNIYSGKSITITGVTSSPIIFDKLNNIDTIILKDLNIIGEIPYAIDIQSNKDLHLIIKGKDTINCSAFTNASIGFPGNKALIQKDNLSSVLVIDGDGSIILTPAKSNTSKKIASPIFGSSAGNDFSGLIIKGGNITATTTLSQIIGPFNESATNNNFVSNVTIEGGVLNLTNSQKSDHSIAGPMKQGEKLIIKGGSITTKGLKINNMDISGGYLYAVNGTNQKLLDGSTVEISGGNVNVESTPTSKTFSSSNLLTNNKGDELYRCRILIPSDSTEQAIKAIEIAYSDTVINWGCNELHTTNDGMITLWVPEDVNVKYKVTTENDKIYNFEGLTINYNDISSSSGETNFLLQGKKYDGKDCTDWTCVNGDPYYLNLNKNEIIFLNNSFIPPLLESKTNIVVPDINGYKANSIEIINNKSFFLPDNVTAAKATFYYSPMLYANSHGGWETLILPFESDDIKDNEGNIIKSYTNLIDGDVIVKCIENDHNSIYFSLADTTKLKAQTPYLIALPGDSFNERSLENKSLIFSAVNACVSTTIENDNDIIGFTFEELNLDNIYTLNNTGTAFEKNETSIVKPFSVYLKNESKLIKEPQTSLSMISEPDIISTDIEDGLININLISDDIYVSGNSIIIDCKSDCIIELWCINGTLCNKINCKKGINKISDLNKGVYIIKNKKLVIM